MASVTRESTVSAGGAYGQKPRLRAPTLGAACFAAMGSASLRNGPFTVRRQARHRNAAPPAAQPRRAVGRLLIRDAGRPRASRAPPTARASCAPPRAERIGAWSVALGVRRHLHIGLARLRSPGQAEAAEPAPDSAP